MTNYPAPFVFDASPLIAGCSFSVGAPSVAELVLGGCQISIPPAVYEEVVTRGGGRPDAREAARLVTSGRIQMADPSVVGAELAELQHYSLGAGDRQALTLAARFGVGATL